MRKRMTSLLLTLVMLLSLVPAMGVTANAEDGFVKVSTYEELRSEVNKGSAKIKLTADIDTTSENSGVGVTSATNLSFKGSGNVLDLNGHKLKLVSNMSVYFIEIYSSDLTIKDSGTNGRIDFEYGESVLGVQRAIVINRSVGVKRAGSLTVDGGTLSSTYLAIILIESYGSITINGGRLYAPVTNSGNSCYIIHSTNRYDIDDTLQLHVNGGELDGRVVLKRDDSSATGTLKYKVTPIKITNGTFKQGLYATWKTWDSPEGKPKNAVMTMDSPTVEITGGVFEKNNDDDQRESRCYIDLPTKLRGGTFKDRSTTIRFVGGEYTWDGTQPQYRASIGNSAILCGNDIRTAYGWSESEWFKIQSPWIYLYPKGGNSVTVIPNAWGMKSVTLDGDPIDYFKDWKGTVERMDNSTAHTLTFEWYPLASELVHAGYTYQTKCEHYISGSTAVQQTDTIAADKTSHTITIEKGADPKVYSYDLQLNLQKDGSFVGIMSNEHIVKLVVDPAQEIDTRTPIDSVTLNVPKLKEGDKSGGNFTLSGANTGVNSTVTTVWEGIPTTGAVAGNFYAARITLTAKDGYAFNTSTQVKLNGDYLSKGSGIDNGGAGMTVYVNVPVRHEHTFSGDWQNLNNDKEYHFKTCSCGAQEKEPHNLKYDESLDKYTCTCGYWIEGTKEKIKFVAASPRSPIDGESPSNYTPEQWVHNIGKNYTVASIDWKDEAGHAVTTFESGKIYKGTVTFKADDGFKFDKDGIQFDRIFDTSTTETVEGYNLDEGAITLIATFKLKDNTVVRPGLQVKVKLPSLNDKIGQSFPEAELVNTTLPGDVELTTSVYENIFDAPITGSVAPNKTYFYAVWLKLGNNDSVEAITKKYNVSYTVTDGGDAEYHTDNVAGYGVLARYQTPDASATSKISSVALTVTAPKYGETPATSATGANDTLYTVGTPEWTPAVTDGKFGADTYTVSIPVTAKSGYSFDANCLYTVNGYVATYADGKVSYTFPALTAPHTHNYTDQPWQYLNPGSHYQACRDNDGALNIEEHTFGTWKKVDETNHSRTCNKCKMTDGSTYTETAEHTWVWVVDQEAALNQPGKQHEECTGCHAKRSENTEIPMLTSIKVEHLTVAKPVKDAAATAPTTTDSTYTVANTEWMAADGTPLAIGGKFQPGTVYTVKITLETAGAGVFSVKSTYNPIEGKTATVSPALTGDNHADSVILTYTFDATEGTYVPTKPAITTVTLPDGKVGDAYSQTLAATGTNPITWGIETGTLPDGLTLVGDTIKGTPSKAGDFKFTVKATNGGGSDTKELTIKIADAEAAKYHNVTLTGAGTGATGAGSHAAGTTVNIYAGTKSGYTFNGWTSDDVTVLSASSKNASFVMPDKDVTVKANWVYNGGGSSGGGYTYYTIKATAGVNGSISPTGNVSVREGRDQTFTITPNKGYAVAKVLIDSKNVGAVKSYTFENVKKNHTIEVVFMKASGNPQTGVFVDVPEGSYYEEAVNWAVEKGITTGTDATHFSPDGICTRAQAVTFLWRAAGSPAAKSAVMPFTDVKAGSYYYDAVLWAVENGITKGTSDTLFSPDATCSRAQIVTFLWRSQKSPAAGTANPFTDVKASAYYADAVLWAVKEDVTKGTTNTTFSPDANCTRAQIVTFIWRALAE